MADERAVEGEKEYALETRVRWELKWKSREGEWRTRRLHKKKETGSSPNPWCVVMVRCHGALS